MAKKAEKAAKKGTRGRADSNMSGSGGRSSEQDLSNLSGGASLGDTSADQQNSPSQQRKGSLANPYAVGVFDNGSTRAQKQCDPHEKA